ncbi:allophanate hydrolase subunit 1 [Amycolatopsis rhizosphaerae]|uniref:Allophanate hydrolase subunit 1 n=1 Tax=Amycolatopsis rhizosphaerae TaxID=2053003 RepID=A0A558CVR6_9PSEU|nr:allophanate hydrolase subunit 1 [Amycolatopsis rhizosphaerae]TVT52813.1 allophanate hydrolase subunit 1 [Amycolatopsis rhizosphaerae]
MKLLPCGDQAFLVEAEDAETVLGLYTALNETRPDGITELVPAASTLLVRFDPRLVSSTSLAERLARTRPSSAGRRGGELITIPVSYDGEDLAEIGERTGLGVDGVIAAHTEAEHTVAFGGFMPGFGYLTGLDPRLYVPRLDTSRTRVPAGAVAIAGEYTGIYPRSSPGGWRLLGHTEVALWDPERPEPALLRPGLRVRFRPVSRPSAYLIDARDSPPLPAIR